MCPTHLAVVPPNLHSLHLPHSFTPWFSQGVDMSLNDIWKHEEMRACERLLDPTLAVHGCSLAVFADSSLPLSERERVRRTGQEMTLLHNVCCRCMTRPVTLRIASPQSSTERCVWATERDGAERVVCSAARGWARGLLLIVQLSLLIMALSNQRKRQQEPKWHFSTLITHVSFVAQLFVAFTHLQSFWMHMSIWFDSFGRCATAQVRETQKMHFGKQSGTKLNLHSLYEFEFGGVLCDYGRCHKLRLQPWPLQSSFFSFFLSFLPCDALECSIYHIE